MKKALPVLIAFGLGLGIFLVWYNWFSDQPMKLSEIDREKARQDSVANLPGGKTPDEAEAAVREKERKLPLDFLKISTNQKRKKIKGQKLSLDIKITNQAKYTSYRDFTLDIQFADTTGRNLGSVTEMIFDSLEPGKEKMISIDKIMPENSDTFLLKLSEASFVDDLP